MIFSNGCRAPPWRQVLGDICYMKVTPCDGTEFCVSACTEGYFVNKVHSCTVWYAIQCILQSFALRTCICIVILVHRFECEGHNISMHIIILISSIMLYECTCTFVYCTIHVQSHTSPAYPSPYHY